MLETIVKILIGIGGGAVTFLFGGWSMLLGILLAFVVIDYVTGFIAAAKEGQLNSEIGLWGIASKVIIFGIVAVAHLVDTALGDATLFRDIAIFFYLANELLSITENAGRIGVPVPPKIEQAVQVLKGKSDRNDD